MPSLAEIENAFQPAKEINDADRFAGRKNAVADIFYALVTEGANIAIVGNKGIGKTSLARQLEAISRGDNALIEKLELPLDHHFDFLQIYFACGKNIRSLDELLEHLLTTSGCLDDWLYDVPKANKEITKFAQEAGLNLGFRGGISGEDTLETASEPAITYHSISTVFTNVCKAIVEEELARDGILVIIDEFDQIVDPTGAAGFLKSLATNVPKVRFCLVGVAKDIQNLMREHSSSDRLFAGSIVRLESMSNSELREIVRIAERSTDNTILFTHEATERLVALSQGHPYMIHLIGKYALRNAYLSGIQFINNVMIQETLRSIAERGADPVLEGRYKGAVGSSAQREIVLRALATVLTLDNECWTTEAYKIALEEGVDNASHYVGQLVLDEYGAEVEKVRERYYRFKDSLFAAYVLARPRQFGE